MISVVFFRFNLSVSIIILVSFVDVCHVYPLKTDVLAATFWRRGIPVEVFGPKRVETGNGILLDASRIRAKNISSLSQPPTNKYRKTIQNLSPLDVSQTGRPEGSTVPWVPLRFLSGRR